MPDTSGSREVDARQVALRTCEALSLLVVERPLEHRPDTRATELDREGHRDAGVAVLAFEYERDGPWISALIHDRVDHLREPAARRPCRGPDGGERDPARIPAEEVVQNPLPLVAIELRGHAVDLDAAEEGDAEVAVLADR